MNLEDLSGLLAPGIGDALSDLASRVPADQAIVEVGSFRGKSTAYLAAGAKAGHGAPVHAVDPWDLPGNPYGKHGYSAPDVREDFESQLRAVRLWSRVTPHRAFSVDAAADWDGPPIGLLFIDGDHSEAAVRADVEAWTPHLAAEHVVAFDDYDTPRNPGVAVVVHSLPYTVEIVADHLAVLR
jgi:hypothetical protein